MPRGTIKTLREKVEELVRHATHQGRVSLFDLKVVERFITLQRKVRQGHIAWTEATMSDAFAQITSENQERGKAAKITIDEVKGKLMAGAYEPLAEGDNGDLPEYKAELKAQFKRDALSATGLYGHRKQEAFWILAEARADAEYPLETLFALQEIAEVPEILDNY
jgi:hypothetical protein